MGNTIDFTLSAFALSSELWGCCFSVPEDVPPPLEPLPPPTPEQIKAQEKRARRAAKRAMQNQVVNPDPRTISKLINFGVPRGLNA